MIYSTKEWIQRIKKPIKKLDVHKYIAKYDII